MDKHSWLVYTKEANRGALCKFCVLFSNTYAGRGNNQLGALVVRPFTNWKKALKTFEMHTKTDYHVFSAQKALHFTRIMEGDAQDVVTAATLHNQKEVEENRKKLCSIVETIILCGRKGIHYEGTMTLASSD